MSAQLDPLYHAMINDGIIIERHSLAETTWGDDEIHAAMDVLRSGQTTMGEITKEYERKFAQSKINIVKLHLSRILLKLVRRLSIRDIRPKPLGERPRSRRR